MNSTGTSAPRWPLFLLMLFLATLRASVASSSTWTVRPQSESATVVQDAINGATSGDTVLVEPGTYYENISFLGKDIVLRSVAAPDQTILDGIGKTKAIVEFRNGESNAAVIDGFTIRNGRGSSAQIGTTSHYGGGIFIQDAEPTIMNNHIVSNGRLQGGPSDVTFWGGGIYCETRYSPISRSRSPIIWRNRIENNRASNNGGGIGITNGRMYANISENTIVDNTAEGGDGGGIWIITIASGTVISGNVVDNNVSGDHGGGVYVAAGGLVPVDVLISENVFLHNTCHAGAVTGDSGGGIWLRRLNATVIHNSIVGNASDGDPLWGGGIDISREGAFTIAHNIIAFSSRGSGIHCSRGATATIENNLFWANAGGKVTGECSLDTNAGDNIEADPYFCAWEVGNLTLAENSPALSHPSGYIGVFGEAGCPPVAIAVPVTWSAIKVRFGN